MGKTLRILSHPIVFALIALALFSTGAMSAEHLPVLMIGATAFTQQETVIFDKLMAGFDDGLVVAKQVTVTNLDPVLLERSQGLQFWRPAPYISTTVDGAAGTDISASFTDITQLSVPLGLGYNKAVPWTMTGNDLNDPMQRERKYASAMQALATQINISCANVASLYGSLVVKRTVAASGFDDLAAADSVMVEQGLVGDSLRRVAILHARDYNSMAGNLAKPMTSANSKVNAAYENGFVGNVSGFDTYKADYTYSLAARAGVTVTVNGANQYFTPKATSTAGTGEIQNVDNRFQTLPITVTSGTVKVGDAFTIAGVNAVHHITKTDTGQLKTFRVTAIVTGAGGTGTVQITPPIISATGATQAEKEYQNVTAAPANGAAITFLNTVTGNVAPYFDTRAIELLPGRQGLDEEMMAAGATAMRSSTELGIEVVLYKWFDIKTKKFLYRADARWGVGCTNPEMAGVVLFNQV